MFEGKRNIRLNIFLKEDINSFKIKYIVIDEVKMDYKFMFF